MSVSMINSINKYKEIYSNLDCYKELRESDQEFFDNLFYCCYLKMPTTNYRINFCLKG